jgi:two-component system CheB/CheR fusion protein
MARKPRLGSDQSNTPAFVPTVAIGCSAGGVRALQSFFEEIPAGLGLSFVVVTHLDPERPSELAAILRRHSPLQVEEVVDKAEFLPDRILIIPPNRQITVQGNRMSVQAFAEPRGQRAPIDRFFRSLAEQHGDGFAVILSGSGSDGAVGLKAIKENGGVILVQEPTEAEFGGMPRSAVATGLADAILPVRTLAARLIELARDKQKLQLSGQANAENAISAILGYLRARTGHDFSRYKRSTVMRRLTRRLQLSRSSELTDYLLYLRENVEEVSALFSDLLISVTTFFRDPEAYDALISMVIPALVTDAVEDPIRIWVPGCATGEEAYSIAMLVLEECAPPRNAPRDPDLRHRP